METKSLEFLIPKEKLKYIKYLRFKKNEFIHTLGDTSVYFLIKGSALPVHFPPSGEQVYPYVYRPDEFIGVAEAISDNPLKLEVMATYEGAEAYRIPRDLFIQYIYRSPIFLERHLPKVADITKNGALGYYIYSQGGAKAYFAFILDYAFKNFMAFPYDRFSDFTKLIYVSKASLYTIINEFLDGGVIQKKKNALILKDRSKLRDYFIEYIS